MSDADHAVIYHQFREQGGVIDLTHRTQLILTGPDRLRYLNGQVTNDVRKLRTGQAQAACVTTAKGRLCADVIITAQDETLIVDAEADLRESLLARLERYIVADDVTIEDATDTEALLHFLGPDPPPTTSRPVITARRFGRDGWDLRLTRQELADTREALLANRLVLDHNLAELLRIEAGIPRWDHELDENTLPPEAALEATHIDYHKGCYIGQEVISRLKSVGHVNRQLTGFIAEDAATPLATGAPLFAAAEGGPSVGVLTSTAFSFSFQKSIALGYLKRGSPKGPLFARPADPTGAPAVVTVRELPFVS